MGAQFNIKDAEVHELATEIAARLGVSKTEAVRRALQGKLRELTRDERLKEVALLVKSNGSLWREPVTSTNHGDFLYDELGLPK
jgi:antitoxin VapB